MSMNLTLTDNAYDCTLIQTPTDVTYAVLDPDHEGEDQGLP
jgi:hypothetical protein